MRAGFVNKKGKLEEHSTDGVVIVLMGKMPRFFSSAP